MDTKIANIISLLRSRNFSEAKSKCSEIENSYINNPEFQNIFAVILFELKDYSKSIEKWNGNQLKMKRNELKTKRN